MGKTGIVEEITETKIILRIYADEACAQCQMCDDGQEMELPRELLPQGISTGDAVTVSASLAPSLLIGLVYGLPLLFLLGGYFLGIFLFPRGGEGGGIGGAAFLFAVSLAVVRMVGRRLNRRAKILITPCKKREE